MEVLGKFNFQINVVLNGLEKYIKFNTKIILIFIDSF